MIGDMTLKALPDGSQKEQMSFYCSSIRISQERLVRTPPTRNGSHVVGAQHGCDKYWRELRCAWTGLLWSVVACDNLQRTIVAATTTSQV
jgi:hypothetical protein